LDFDETASAATVAIVCLSSKTSDEVFDDTALSLWKTHKLPSFQATAQQAGTAPTPVRPRCRTRALWATTVPAGSSPSGAPQGPSPTRNTTARSRTARTVLLDTTAMVRHIVVITYI